MPFNKANPSDTSKIRNLGINIRPNWKAIEEGSQDDANPNKLKYWAVNLFSRDDIPDAPGADAPQVDDGLAVFAKTDTDTDLPEMFIRHEDSSITQMTKGPANIAPSGYADNGETFLPGGLILKYALLPVQASNALVTFTWAGTGANQLGLSSFPTNCFNIQMTIFSTGSNGFVPRIGAYTKDDFELRGSNMAAQYFITAIGN
jgi:hypothetical protein